MDFKLLTENFCFYPLKKSLRFSHFSNFSFSYILVSEIHSNLRESSSKFKLLKTSFHSVSLKSA